MFHAAFTSSIRCGGQPFLVAEPFDTRHQRVCVMAVDGGRIDGICASETSGQRALLITPEQDGEVRFEVEFALEPGAPPEWLGRPVQSAWFAPAPALAEEVRALTITAKDRGTVVRRIVDHVTARFSYGHRDAFLATGEDAMPALTCDVTMGSCVDIHSYAIAALSAVGIHGIYLAGIFTSAGDLVDDAFNCIPGHCWMETLEPCLEDWDLAHILKFGVPLPAQPVLNPVPGLRFAVQSGRGHVFVTPRGRVSVDRLTKPVALDGQELAARFTVRWSRGIA